MKAGLGTQNVLGLAFHCAARMESEPLTPSKQATNKPRLLNRQSE
jgi:hypothetical protein